MPQPSVAISSMATFTSNSVEETIGFARRWSERLRPNDVVALVGDLGAGKTQFVKGLLLGIESGDAATSPTFTLLHEYRGGRLPIFHFDLYRLREPAEIEEIGFADYLEDGGVTVIEWADRFPHLLPGRTRWLRFEIVDESRRRIMEEPS
jgi:tRNA threonylcarbamoyladenosine biosynthesis protein TsaE